jgi:hypothetical protein
VLYHDAQVDGRFVSTMTLREMRRRCGAPSLRQLLVHFLGARITLHLDVKCDAHSETDFAAFAHQLDKLLRSAMALRRWRGGARVSSFWPEFIDALAARQPPYALGLITEQAPAQLGAALSFVVLPQELLLSGEPLPWLRGDLEVYVYTVNTLDSAQRLLEHRTVTPRGLITDNRELPGVVRHKG